MSVTDNLWATANLQLAKVANAQGAIDALMWIPPNLWLPHKKKIIINQLLKLKNSLLVKRRWWLM
jgi:hypothetical protein